MKRLPTEPGTYWWTEWSRYVRVYMRGSRLVVKVYNHWQPVTIGPRIAGEFLERDPAGTLPPSEE